MEKKIRMNNNVLYSYWIVSPSVLQDVQVVVLDVMSVVASGPWSLLVRLRLWLLLLHDVRLSEAFLGQWTEQSPYHHLLGR